MENNSENGLTPSDADLSGQYIESPGIFTNDIEYNIKASGIESPGVTISNENIGKNTAMFL